MFSKTQGTLVSVPVTNYFTTMMVMTFTNGTDTPTNWHAIIDVLIL